MKLIEFLKNKLLIFSISIVSLQASAQLNEPIVLGYFPSWSETWVAANQDSPLRSIPSYVTHVFLSFAKPDLEYVADSYDISQTGINVPYDGCALKESVSALNDKGIKVILSIGGETYWTSSTIYNDINYQQIKDLVDDMGFAGIDWDYEPNGSFSQIGDAANVQHFVDMITNSRALMPAAQGYIIACAPSGVGALGGQVNNDPASPFNFSSRNTVTGESDANLYNGTAVTNGINLYGFSSTGHMIPVFQACGSMIDIVAYQGYNCGGSNNREIMYDSYAHYAEIHGFHVAAGVHYPNEPWGPYYTYTHTNIASLSDHIRTYAPRIGDNDGIMIWQLLMTGVGSSAYSYLNVASQVLNGTSQNTAVTNANNFSMQPYTGGAQGCSPGGGGGNLYCGYAEYNAANSYPTSGTQVYYNCAIWQNQWWANPGEIPGVDAVWTQVSTCAQTPTVAITSNTNDICAGTPVTFTAALTGSAQNVTYQWQVNANNVGTNSSTYTTSSLNNADVVTCIVTSSGNCGSGNSTSNSVTITVSNASVTPAISIGASNNGSICSGAPVTFTATPTNGGNAPAYQWKINGNNVGTNSPTFTSSSLNDGDVITCVLTSNSACASVTTATSNSWTAEITTVLPPSVEVVNACGFSTLTANGTQLLWSTSETTQSIDVENSGTYSVTQSMNGCTSVAASITANPLPLPTVTLASFDTVCDDALAFTLSGGIPAGGNYSGIGVSNGTFSPSQAGIGIWEITYLYADANGCENEAQENITVEDCANLSEIDQEYQLFPNPAQQNVFISGLKAGSQLFFRDAQGKIVLTYTTISNGDTESIELSMLSPGVYFISVSSNQQHLPKRLIVH